MVVHVRVGRAARVGACLGAVLLSGCGLLSPQVVDTRPTYGFTKVAKADANAEGGGVAGSGSGFYQERCKQDGETDGCPVFYGMLPAAVDDADAKRLEYLRAFLNESGTRRALNLALVPAGAYALYRGIFSSSDTAKRDVARAAIGAGAAFTYASNDVSPERQSIRLAAAEALNCAIHGSVARYLWEKRLITGEADSRLPSGSRGLVPAGKNVRDAVEALQQQRDELRKRVRQSSGSRTAVVADGSGCAAGSKEVYCVWGRHGPKKANRSDPALPVYLAELERGGTSVEAAAVALQRADELKTRIDDAPLHLIAATRQIEAAAAKASQATEADLESLRKSVAGLRLVAQDFGLPASGSTATTTGTSGTTGLSLQKGQASIETTVRDDRAAIVAAEATAEPAADARRRLDAAVTALDAFQAIDRRRAEQTKALADCQFTTPGLRLDVEPPLAPVLTPGSPLRFSALGGTQLPTVSLVGASALLAGDVLKLEPDTTAGRQVLNVVFTAPAKNGEQTVTLVFKNGDLSVSRQIVIRPAAGGSN